MSPHESSLWPWGRFLWPRRRLRAAGAAAVLLLLAAALAGRRGYLGVFSGDDRTRYDQGRFVVAGVVDGDTLDLAVYDPHARRAVTRVRLLGVDAPETVHPQLGAMHYGAEAAARTAELVAARRVTVRLEPFETTRDRYGRLLAYIYLEDGRLLNEILIAEGCGYAEERFAHVLRERFLAVQRAAHEERRGLWAEAQPEDWPPWYRRRHGPER